MSKAIRHPPCLAIAVACCGLMASCDNVGSESGGSAATSSMTLVLGTAEKRLEQHCQSVVDNARLTAVPVGETGGTEIGPEPAEFGSTTVFKQVTVPNGMVLFSVKIRNQEETNVLLSGEAAFDVQNDNFDFPITVEAESPIMEVCLPDGVQEIVILNRGSGLVNWSIEPACPEPLGAEDTDCLIADPSASGAVAQSDTVSYIVVSDTLNDLAAKIESAEGVIDLVLVHVDGGQTSWNAQLVAK